MAYTYGEAGDEYGRAGRLALVEDASGGEAYYYSRMGEVTKTVRTVMASVADIRTYVYGATYDSWNRVRTMTYPDGEVVTYHYDEAGQVSKVGYQSLTKKIQLQIRKDAELVKNGDIDGATWHFFRSPITGKIGGSKPLINELKRNGIKVVIHDK